MTGPLDISLSLSHNVLQWFLLYLNIIFRKILNWSTMRAKEIIVNWESGYGGCLYYQQIVTLSDLCSEFPHLKTESSKFMISKVPPDLSFSLAGLKLLECHFRIAIFQQVCLLRYKLILRLLNFKPKVYVNQNKQKSHEYWARNVPKLIFLSKSQG